MSDKKTFNIKLYSIFSVCLVAVFLIVTVVFTFKAKYTAFHPEKLAVNFVESVISGDGYNAYKNTLVSKNMKFGDFIRENFINPAVKRDMADGRKDYSDDSFKGEKTLNDDGTLAGKLTSLMFPVYCELVETYGWDDYSAVFGGYIEKLIVTREDVFGDKFFNDEVFFTAFEANVSQYCDMLKGTNEIFDENTGVKISEETRGKYEELFGENYSFTVNTVSEKAVDINEYKNSIDSEQFSLFGVSASDISDVKTISVEVKLGKDKLIAVSDIVMVKIGYSWYVDNTSTDTDVFYYFNF